MNLRFSAIGAVLTRRAWFDPIVLVNRLVPVLNDCVRIFSVGTNSLAMVLMVVMRTEAGKALPSDRSVPMRLPGRICILACLVSEVSILPTPTPSSAFEFARHMLSGKRLRRVFRTTLLAVVATVRVRLVETTLRLVPIAVVVRPMWVTVTTRVGLSAALSTGKPLSVCRARVCYRVRVGILTLFTSLCLAWADAPLT